MGTMLNARGVGFDTCFDALNLTNPALVAEVHREYIEAGSQVIQTNTFGANRYKLAAHGLEDKVAEINRAGVELARRVVLGILQGRAGRRRCRPAGRAPGALRARAARAGPPGLRRADRGPGRGRR